MYCSTLSSVMVAPGPKNSASRSHSTRMSRVLFSTMSRR